MKQDTIQTVIDTLYISTEQSVTSSNIWMWMAIVELVVIVLLLFIRHKRPYFDSISDAKRKVKAEGNIDFDNTIQSAFHAEALYKELLVKCHPDRFATDDIKHAIADELSAKIGENKTNYKCLVEIKEEAITKLNIK